MKSIKRVVLTSVAKYAFQTAKLEADSACFCFFLSTGYAPKSKRSQKEKITGQEEKCCDGQDIKPADQIKYY